MDITALTAAVLGAALGATVTRDLVRGRRWTAAERRVIAEACNDGQRVVGRLRHLHRSPGCFDGSLGGRPEREAARRSGADAAPLVSAIRRVLRWQPTTHKQVWMFAPVYWLFIFAGATSASGITAGASPWHTRDMPQSLPDFTGAAGFGGERALRA